MIKSKNISSDLARDTELVAGLALKYDTSNPSNFETPSQLNSRDTNNRARANHTGTQSSSTISDFATTVRSTVLTGLNTATTALVSASDTILSAFGKLQAQINTMLVSTVPLSTGTTNTAGNSTALAKANHIHNTVLESDVISDMTEQTTAARDYVSMTGISVTPPAGTYIIKGITQSNNTGWGVNNFFRLAVGGTGVTGTAAPVNVQNAGTWTWSTSEKVVLNGSQAITFQWYTPSGTAKVFRKELTYIRVG